MELTDFQTAQTLQANIAAITALQNKITAAGAGAKAVVVVVDADNNLICNKEELTDALGTAYTTVCSTALTSINTQLTTVKASDQSDFDDLGTGE